MNYIITDDIEKATHWIPKYDDNETDEYYEIIKITLGKEYPIVQDWKEDKEYWIINDDGTMSMIWLCHEGYFIIKN